MKRKLLDRLYVFLLIVMILSVSVGDAFISVNDISVLHAAGPAVLGYDIMYEMCRYIGSVYLGYASTRETSEVNIHDDDVARIGYQVIKTEIETGWFNTAIDGGIMHRNAALMGVLIEGQQYVFGSEAFEQVAETEFTVIQGGKNDGSGDDDDDDEDDDNIIHFPKTISDTAKKWFALTATGAAALGEFISSDYQKWLNGDPENILDDFLNEFPCIDDSDIAAQRRWTEYKYSYVVVSSGMLYSLYSKPHDVTYRKIYSSSNNASCSVAGFFDIRYYDDYIYYSFTCSQFKSNGTFDSFSGPVTLESYINDDYGVSEGLSFFTISESDYLNHSYTYNVTFTPFANFPIFTDQETMKKYLRTGEGYEDAYNYAKTYRVADWLQDDWEGTLLDPLTGLNALSNWYNIVRHQGLNALGDEATADDLADWIRDYFAQLGTDTLPEVDPSKAPVKFPETVEDVVFDPTSNPAVYPASDPNPGTGDNPGTDPGGDNKPGTGSDTDVDMDENDYKVDLRGIFPFCIPFDFVVLLNVLDAEPVAPNFDIPVVIPALDYQKNVTLDMSIFDDVAKVIRICEKVSFVIFLMFATSKVIRW